jgi:hypothetical protein
MNRALPHTLRLWSSFAILAAFSSLVQALAAEQTPPQPPVVNGEAAGQSSPQKQAVVAQGLETPWDVRKILSNLDASNGQLKPLLSQINPQKWSEENGAPSTYIAQWQTAQQQVNDVLTVSKQLASKTEDLPLAIDTYFRMEALEVSTRSLNEGLQKYGDRALAGKLARILAQNFDSRERFRGYLRDLAVSTEQNFKIADEEAQRCRAMISKEPLQNSGKKAKRN